MEYFNDEWRKIIINHFKNPKYKGFILHKDAIVHHQPNLNCSDHLQLQLVIEKQKILSARFEGIACILSISSADIVCHNIINKDIEQAKKILISLKAMMNGESFDNNALKDFMIFLNSKDQMFRQQCILLAVNGFLSILEKLNVNE